jgi:hypothetical protein
LLDNADTVLRKKRLAVNDRSRELLIKEVNFTYELAINRTKAYSESDYSPDTNLSRFPAWQAPPQQHRAGLNLPGFPTALYQDEPPKPADIDTNEEARSRTW